MEAALALHQLLAPGAAKVTLVAPEPEFQLKPMVVAEPFTRIPAERHELAPALRELDTGFVEAAVVSVHPETRTVKLASATSLTYDFLLVALGGRARPAFSLAETFWAGHGGTWTSTGSWTRQLRTRRGRSHSWSPAAVPGPGRSTNWR